MTHRLCWARGPWAVFATELTKVDGDSWHKRSLPGEPGADPGCELLRVAWECDGLEPVWDQPHGPPYSHLDAVRHGYPLISESAYWGTGRAPINAGVTLDAFTARMLEAGGMVYLPECYKPRVEAPGEAEKRVRVVVERVIGELKKLA